jgi:hypothetical protein
MNLTYVLSTLAQNLLTLCLLILVSLAVRPPQKPWDGLIQAINRNQLCVFLAVGRSYLHPLALLPWSLTVCCCVGRPT